MTPSLHPEGGQETVVGRRTARPSVRPLSPDSRHPHKDTSSSTTQPMLRPKQSLGQNFLRDPNIVRKIVGAVRAPEGAHVVEIGPGTGALTGLLFERFETFTAIEIDERAVALLRGEHPNLDVRHEDIMDVDWRRLADEKGGPVWVVGNLPYNITSQVLFGMIDAGDAVQEAVVMMQYEVAQRLVAEPRTKEYGILSVQVQLHAAPNLLFKVSPNVFFPRPDVDSAVVRLDFGKRSGALNKVGHEFLRSVIRSAFNQRRKTLRNSLSEWTRGQDIPLPEIYQKRRAEELEPAEFVELACYLEARVQLTETDKGGRA